MPWLDHTPEPNSVEAFKYQQCPHVQTHEWLWRVGCLTAGFESKAAIPAVQSCGQSSRKTGNCFLFLVSDHLKEELETTEGKYRTIPLIALIACVLLCTFQNTRHDQTEALVSADQVLLESFTVQLLGSLKRISIHVMRCAAGHPLDMFFNSKRS